MTATATEIFRSKTTAATKTCQSEADKFGAFARRILRAYGRRVADRDIEGLTGLVALRDEVDAEIRKSTQALQEQGYSWAEIGRVLGISKQACQQRFGKKN
jgi:hypothetical protein